MAQTTQAVTRGDERDQAPTKGDDNDFILYKVNERPPWYLCILLGFQQFLTAFGATFGYPILIKHAICIEGDDVGLGELISSVIFVSGLSTLLQSTFGTRLPIIQSVSYSFVTPIFVVLSLNAANCPFNDPNANSTQLPELGSDAHQDIWKENLRELQGCLMVASVLSIFIGFSGIIGLLMRYIGPLTVAPTISLIALSLFEAASTRGSKQWYICFMTIVLVALFSQYLRNVAIPFGRQKIKIFAMFPVLLAVILSWVICVVLTETDALPSNSTKWGYEARTDVNSDVLKDSKWFRFPYPGQWGSPKISLAGTLGMLAAVLASTVESVGDYYACARLSGAPSPPSSAVNRGIGVEGITCFLAGLWGIGAGTTSYSENVGAIGITKVGSRIVVQVSAVIMILLGCLGKFGALFVTIPEPVVGGLFYVMFGMVGAVGISNLQFVDLSSSRNLFVFGLSLFFGLSVPDWISKHPNAIDTGNSNANQVLNVLFGTSMFVGGALAFILDNTVPGTPEERGLISWKIAGESGKDEDLSVYNLPFIQPWIDRVTCFKYFPVCPSFVLDKKKPSSENGATKQTENGKQSDRDKVQDEHINEAFCEIDESGHINTRV